MPLLQATLAQGLASMAPTVVEADAINTLATAWETYFSAASVQGVPCLTLSAPMAAFRAALVGMSAANAGPNKIQAAVDAFWGVVAGSAATIWLPVPNVVVPPAIKPPTISGIAAALSSVASASTAANASLEQASNDIAAVLHTNGGLGGTVTIQPPGAVPPVPSIPIL
jgi:hypothetical protein